MLHYSLSLFGEGIAAGTLLMIDGKPNLPIWSWTLVVQKPDEVWEKKLLFDAFPSPLN